MPDPTADIRRAPTRFQDGYLTRHATKLDDFMRLFVPGDEIELIGSGAGARNANEWVQP